MFLPDKSLTSLSSKPQNVINVDTISMQEMIDKNPYQVIERFEKELKTLKRCLCANPGENFEKFTSSS